MVVPDNVLRGRGRGVDRAPSRPRRLRRQLQGRGAGKALGDRAIPPFNRRRSDGRDKANLDIFWLRDESLEDTDNLPAPGVIAAEIVEDLQSALAEFTELAESLHGIDVEIEEERMDTEVRTPQLVVMQPQRSSCRFQRPYVWNQENQWGPLWRDVTSAPPFAAVCRWPAGEPSVPRTDRHEVLHIMASDNARKPCAGTALRGHEMHTVPIRRDHEHGGPLGTIRLDICQHVLHRPRSEIRSGPVARLSVNLGVRSRLSVSGRRQYPQCVPSPPQVRAVPPQEIQRLLS